MANSLLLAVNITLMYSAPLILAALGGVITERAGVINIGIEGMMTFGAFAGAAGAFYTGNPWAGFLFAGAAGAFLALFHAVASVSFLGNQTISGVAINFVGGGLSLFLSRLLFDGATTTMPVPHKLPKTLSLFFGEVSDPVLQNLNVDVTVPVALILALIVWYALYRTRAGLRLRAVGAHPAAADTLGVNVYLIRYAAVILSGLFAGFGGAAQSIAVVSQFSPTVISGHGFIALAAVIFGGWTPQGAVGACLTFGFAQALVVLLGGGVLPIPSQLLAMLPYVLTILVLILFVGRSSAPKANGIPYQKGVR